MSDLDLCVQFLVEVHSLLAKLVEFARWIVRGTIRSRLEWWQCGDQCPSQSHRYCAECCGTHHREIRLLWPDWDYCSGVSSPFVHLSTSHVDLSDGCDRVRAALVRAARVRVRIRGRYVRVVIGDGGDDGDADVGAGVHGAGDTDLSLRLLLHWLRSAWIPSG